MLQKTSAASLFIFVLFSGLVMGADIYVPDDHPTIQDAINAASNGDIVIVRQGTYVEKIDFLGKAITVESELGPDLTTIDGNQTGSVVTFQNNEGAGSVLTGFTITNGSGTDISQTLYGGGIFCIASPSIRDNVIISNSAERGGGILCSASPEIRGNVISSNSALFQGGGIYCDQGSSPAMADNEISQNSSTSGGGICCMGNTAPSIEDSVMKGNTAFDGAGIYCGTGSDVVIAYCLINENTATNWGGGIWCELSCSLNIRGSTLSGNSALNGGGIACYESPTGLFISNCIFSFNTAGDQSSGFGGGIYCSNCITTAYLLHCTFAENAAFSGEAVYLEQGSYMDIVNSIVWGGQSSQNHLIHIADPVYPSTLALAYSDLDGGKTSVQVDQGCTFNWGSGNIDLHPIFATSGGAHDDFHITYGSPCKDSGDNASSLPLQYDFEKDPRIAEGTADMGADEFHDHLYHNGDATPGGSIQIRVFGLPTLNVILGLGSGIQDPPQPTPHGNLYLTWPIQQVPLGQISRSGLLIYPATVPPIWQPGDERPLQALIGNNLSNLHVFVVE